MEPSSRTLGFLISRVARDRHGLTTAAGRLGVPTPAVAHRLAAHFAVTAETPKSAADLYALALLETAARLALHTHTEQRDSRAFVDAETWFTARLGAEPLTRLWQVAALQFPALDGPRAPALESLLLLWLANENRAALPYRDLFDDRPLSADTIYAPLTALLFEYFETRPRFGPDRMNLVAFLRAPALAAPHSLQAQLAYIRARWKWLLGPLLEPLVLALDLKHEEERYLAGLGAAQRGQGIRAGDSSERAVPRYGSRSGDHEYEAFSRDEAWMPRTVLIAKSTYVWLDQLARDHGRSVCRLDEIPEEALNRLAAFGINALWLIGLWERSPASQRIKQLCGNPDAAASAYSLHDYTIAADLGGEEAWGVLRDRAMARGIRLASDMVPNHMGLDSPWVIEHPEWFLQLPYSPYPSYRFDGPDLSRDPNVALHLEDHYFDRSDAAVVFRRMDRNTGEQRFLYHGNDGTSFPWNDTAQLDYLDARVREHVIQTILAVARRFPIIRFDAAMTLAKKHVQRLWFPEPGSGEGIPSRAGHGMTQEQFDHLMPQEFWREVVNRVAAEAPGTLLLAEAFWMMEGYFVRTLGMHRVYNSAFMNMLRDEQNANYRTVIKNTLEFDPDVLQRYVNFLNNPDEKTSVEQFGRGEKYFGVCTLMATLPGLPMFGHGQMEGFEEKYGMEFRRAQRVEPVDQGMLDEHWRRISPLLHRRALFAGAADFLLYDCTNDRGRVNEDVYAYSNRSGDDAALVLFHNRYASAEGSVHWSVAYAEKRGDGSRSLRRRSIAEGLGLPAGDRLVRCREVVRGQEHLLSVSVLREQGLSLALEGYGSRVYIDWRAVDEDGRPWRELAQQLGGAGCADLEDALWRMRIAPVHDALAGLLAMAVPATARTHRAATLDAFLAWAKAATLALGIAFDEAASSVRFAAHLDALEVLRAKLSKSKGPSVALLPHTPASADPVGERLRLAWVALRAIGDTADGKQVDTARRLFTELRLHETIAHVLQAGGGTDDQGWRGAARLRAGLAHPDVFPANAGTPDADTLAAYFADPDVRWLLDTDEHPSAPPDDDARAARETGWLRLAQLLTRVQAALEPQASTATKRAAGPGTLAALAAQPLALAIPAKAKPAPRSKPARIPRVK
ncbi:MAG: alpha-amylase family glycosyl hydrolase [Candidatus Eisenbacteria bacterium]